MLRRRTLRTLVVATWILLITACGTPREYPPLRSTYRAFQPEALEALYPEYEVPEAEEPPRPPPCYAAYDEGPDTFWGMLIEVFWDAVFGDDREDERR